MRSSFLKFTLLLSILAGASTFAYYDRFFDKHDIDVTLPENWRRMSTQEKLDRLDGLLSKSALFSPLSEIEQFKLRRRLRKMIVDRDDEVLGNGFNYRLGFHYDLGWKELSLLGLAGFASVWIVYAMASIIILLIPRGITEPSLSLPSSGRVRYPERPPKPRAVWID